MRNRRRLFLWLAALFAAAALVVAGWWIKDGMRMVSQDRVEVRTVDPIFGTESITYVDAPPKLGFEYAAPIAGSCLAAAVLCGAVAWRLGTRIPSRP